MSRVKKEDGVHLVDVPPLRYLAVDGKSAPEDDEFQHAVEALYAFAFTIKMTRKNASRPTFDVSKLEGLWWVQGDGANWASAKRSDWRWQLLIAIPDFVDDRDLAAARAALARRGKPAADAAIHIVTIAEAQCAEVMHVGSFATEPRTIAQMDAFVAAHGLEYTGRHHEIYLNDPRRTAPERLHTLLRHPVRAIHPSP